MSLDSTERFGEEATRILDARSRQQAGALRTAHRHRVVGPNGVLLHAPDGVVWKGKYFSDDELADLLKPRHALARKLGASR